jgi:hypothetical protein
VGGIAAVALFPPTRSRVFLSAVVAAYVLLHVVAFGHHRFHLPVLPIFLIGAAAAMTRSAWLAASRPRKLMAIGLMVLMIGVLLMAT